MTKVKPVRLQMKRIKGFRLQEESKKINGLPCVLVSRPSKWGNPFYSKAVKVFLSPRLACELYRVYLKDHSALVENIKKELKGKNLACFCFESWHCHADVLLEIANN